MNTAPHPDPLQSGDRVHLLSISRAVDFDLAPARQLLESWGLIVSEGPTVAARYAQFAGNADVRARDFQTALDDEDIKAIFFCRGGYGAAQIIDRIDFSRFAQNPKWLVGSSDITLVHAHVARLGIPTLHAVMPIQYATAHADDFSSLRSCLFDSNPRAEFHNLTITRPASLTGIICGGNLSMIATLAGTPSDIDYTDKILLIEDVYENLMSIERILLTLKRAGKLARLKALLVGGFAIPLAGNETSNAMFPDLPVSDDSSAGQALERLIRELTAEYTYPVCFGLPVGHAQGRNRAVRLNTPVQLDIDTKSLTISYPTA